MLLYIFTVPGEVTGVSLTCQPAESYNNCTAMWNVSYDNWTHKLLTISAISYNYTLIDRLNYACYKWESNKLSSSYTSVHGKGLNKIVSFLCMSLVFNHYVDSMSVYTIFDWLTNSRG